MELELIKDKKVLYTNKLFELDNKNINEIVNEKLEEKRLEVEAQVRNEIQKDREKCEYYLALLNELEYEYDAKTKEVQEIENAIDNETFVEGE